MPSSCYSGKFDPETLFSVDDQNLEIFEPKTLQLCRDHFRLRFGEKGPVGGVFQNMKISKAPESAQNLHAAWKAHF